MKTKKEIVRGLFELAESFEQCAKNHLDEQMKHYTNGREAEANAEYGRYSTWITAACDLRDFIDGIEI